MKKDSLKILINDAMKYANQGNRSHEAFTYEKALGATIGQVLFCDSNHDLVMHPCWMGLQVIYSPHKEEYGIGLRPLCKVNAPYYIHTVLSEKLLKTLTGTRHSFGGETVRFKYNAHPTLSHYENLAIAEQRIKAPENVLNIIPAVRQEVRERDGDLIVANGTIFNIGTPRGSFMDKRDCFIREYDRLTWVEPRNEHAKTGECSEREALYSASIYTSHKAIVVPTVWIKDNGLESECFLSFAGDWRQSKYGDRVSCKVGKFLVTHELHREHLITRTSLRLSDSVWQPTQKHA